MQEKIEDIKHIQNTIWAMYKDFLANHDMKAYNRKMRDLSKKYSEKGDQQLISFVQGAFITWCPIINGFAEEFRKVMGDEK